MLQNNPIWNQKNLKFLKSLNDTDFIMTNMFWIGVHPRLDYEMMDYMVEKITEFIKFE